MKSVILSVVGLLFCASISAQTLWGGTSISMSIDEVKKAQPAASDAIEKPGKLDNGAIERLRVSNVEIDGLLFVAVFYFLGDKLNQVSLSSRDVAPDSVVGKYRSLAEALKAKYGDELAKKFDNSRLGVTASSTWQSGKTTIRIHLLSFGGSPASLYIFYNATLATTAEKL